jgi:hypothetical protein
MPGVVAYPTHALSSFDSSMKLIDIVISDSPRPSHSEDASASLLPKIFMAYLPRTAGEEGKADRC